MLFRSGLIFSLMHSPVFVWGLRQRFVHVCNQQEPTEVLGRAQRPDERLGKRPGQSCEEQLGAASLDLALHALGHGSGDRECDLAVDDHPWWHAAANDLSCVVLARSAGRDDAVNDDGNRPRRDPAPRHPLALRLDQLRGRPR